MSFSDILKAGTSFHQVGPNLQGRRPPLAETNSCHKCTTFIKRSTSSSLVVKREFEQRLRLMVDYGHVLIKVGKCRTSHHTRLSLFGGSHGGQEVDRLLEMTIIDVSHVRFHAASVVLYYVWHGAGSGNIWCPGDDLELALAWWPWRNSGKMRSSRWCSIGAYI